MVFHRVNGKFPAVFAQFDQALRQAHHILKLHVCVHHAVQNQQAVFQAFGVVDGRTAGVGDAVQSRGVQDIGGVRVIVVRPVGH